MTPDVEAVVQTPVAGLAEATRSGHWCDNLDTYGCFKPGFQPFVDFGTISPNYVQRFWPDDGHKRKAFPRYGVTGHIPKVGAAYPCPLKLQPGTGTDAQCTVVLPDGSYVNYWNISTPTTPNAFNPFAPVNQYGGVFDLGYDMHQDACVGTVEVVPANEQGNASTMSPAVPMNVGITRYTEVAAGKIGHALAMCISRRCGMTGKVAPSSITDVEDPSIGVTGGYRAACSPARILTPSAPTIAEQTIPEAMRFPVDLTDDDIDQWLDVRKYTGALYNTALIFGVALRDFGLILTAFGGTGTIYTDGDPLWAGLGITKNLDLLHGLITRDNLRALRPPTSTYLDGTTGTREGAAKSISYVTAAG